MDYGWVFSRKIRCSSQDKRQCLGMVGEVISLAKKARQLGLMSLVDYMEQCPNYFLKKGLELIVDGEKPQAVREILELYILAGGYRGKDLLERCVILEGLMGIQNGLSPKRLTELLLSFFGEEGARLYAAEFTDSSPGDMESFLRGLERATPSPDRPDGLNAAMDRLNDEEIQHCLREIGTMDLAKAFKGFSPKIQRRVFNNLPQRGATFLREVIEHMEAVAPADAAEAQERIAAILSDLRADAPGRARTPAAG
jgi:FliG C-terminal domain